MAGAAQYLQNLPSRGFFSQPSSTMGGMKVYICQHDTAPPDEQLIKTDSTNILIRALTLKKEKGRTEQKSKDNKGKVAAAAAAVTPEEGNGKRPAERQPDDKPASKRANISNGSTPERKDGASIRLSGKNLQVCTVQQLKAMLKEMNLPLKGNKEELVARLVKEQKR